MAFTLDEQLSLGINSIQSGDLDLFSSMLLDPRSVTVDEQRSIAQRLGFKGGFQKFIVDTVSDPTVWVAFLLSRRYPVASFLKNVVPHRYVAANNDFTGISQFTRPVEGYFRGTNVPKLTALSMQRHAEVMKVGSGMFNKFINRPNWEREMPTVSLLLEGQNPAAATPELRALATSIRSDMDSLWGFLNQTKKITGGLDGQDITRAKAGELPPSRAGKYLRDYLPHIPTTYSDQTIMQISGKEALEKVGAHRLASALKSVGSDPTKVWSINESAQLQSNFAQWQSFLNNGGHKMMSDRMFRRDRHNIPIQSQMGQELFVTDLNVVLQQYVHSVARTYSNNAPLSAYERRIASTLVEQADGTVKRIMPTSDPIIVQVINEGIDNMGGTVRDFTIPGTNVNRQVLMPNTGNVHMHKALKHLVRSLNGDMLEDEIMWGNLYSSARARFDRASKRALNKKQESQLDAALKAVERTKDYRKHTSSIASYFYGSTLGLNAWSTVQNLLQPALTVIPELGIGSTLAGYRTLGQRLPEYARKAAQKHRLLRSNQSVGYTRRFNTALEEAFEETFPELSRVGLKVDPRLFDVSEEAMLNVGRQKKFRDGDAYMKAILQPFTQSESANQVVAFYGAKEAMRKGIRTGEYKIPNSPATGRPMEGVELDGLMNFEAGNVVNSTQFRPGPGSRTVFQSILPAPIRQFSTFPVRLFNYFTESTVRGAMTNRQMQDAGFLDRLTGGRNLGPVLRTFAIGKVLTNGVRDTLGVDLGGALGVTTPFLNVAPSAGLIPLPTPPLPQLLYGVASYTATRDIKDLQPLTLPGIGEIPFPKTLVPAGGSASRFFRAVNQWRPDLGGMTDENERLMWRGGTTDFLLAALGIPLEKQRRTRNVMERMYANRSLMRDYRRQAANAIINMDYDGLQSLQHGWARAMPDMPPLVVSPKDILRYRTNSRIPVVQRMLGTMGSGAKYLQDDIYEFDPDLVAPVSPLGQMIGAQ